MVSKKYLRREKEEEEEEGRMGSKVFELSHILDRVEELVQGERIEVLEYSLGSLYVGTSTGRLLQYGLAEWKDDQGRRQFSTNHLATKEVVTGQRISSLHAAPAINRLLVFADSTLFILSLSDLTVLPMAGGNKLKGLSAVCVNSQPGEGGPYTLEVCVAKRKQGQLALLSLSEDKMAVVRTRDCPHPVLSMALSGSHLCCAHPHTYTVYHLGQGGQLDLFPLEQSEGSLPPPVLPVGLDEFLLLGPGNLGVFVRAGGEAGRPPVQWTSAPSHLILSDGHVLGVGGEGVTVHNLEDQEMRQGIAYHGGRWAGLCDGTLLICTGARVDCLSQLPWEQQAQTLLEGGEVDRAVILAQGRPGHQGQEILTRAGFVKLQAGDYTRACELLLSGNCDPREVVSLAPNLLPTNSKFVRSGVSPPLHSIASLEGPQSQAFLCTYIRSVLSRWSSHSTALHTALARLTAVVEPDTLYTVLREEAHQADWPDLASGWSKSGHHHHSALAQWMTETGKESAVRVWASLLTGQLQDQTFPGLEFFVSVLASCPNTVIYSHADLVLSRDPHLAGLLFRHLDDEEADTILNILSKYPVPRLEFLEWLVLEKCREEERYHTQLALAFITRVRDNNKEEVEEKTRELHRSYRSSLSRLVLTSKHLNTQFLLQQLKDTDLYYEQAILQGKLGAHDKALDILVNLVKDHKLAETYCDDISDTDKALRGRLLLLLLSLYLAPSDDPSIQDTHTVRAVELLNSRAEELPGSQVLSLLPSHWNISIILPALRRLSRGLVHQQRMTKVTKNLHRGENVQLRAQLAELTRSPVLLLPSSYCVVCNKTFSEGGVARYPNGVTLHPSCVKDERVCPLTGQVFTVAK